MRPLAYAALVVALAGCSLPYRDTSFAAQPGLEGELHGHGKEEGEGRKNDQTVEPKAELRAEAGAVRMYTGEGDTFQDVGRTIEVEGDPMSRTGAVFPPTAQPAAEPVARMAAVGAQPGVDPDAKPRTNLSGSGASGETSPNMNPPSTTP